MGLGNAVARFFLNANNMIDGSKYGTLRHALDRRIKELQAQGIPLTVENVSEKVLKSGMSMRALATRGINAKDVRDVAQGMINTHHDNTERHLSFKNSEKR